VRSKHVFIRVCRLQRSCIKTVCVKLLIKLIRSQFIKMRSIAESKKLHLLYIIFQAGRRLRYCQLCLMQSVCMEIWKSLGMSLRQKNCQNLHCMMQNKKGLTRRLQRYRLSLAMICQMIVSVSHIWQSVCR